MPAGWSEWGESNSRPPAPKAEYSMTSRPNPWQSIFRGCLWMTVTTPREVAQKMGQINSPPPCVGAIYISRRFNMRIDKTINQPDDSDDLGPKPPTNLVEFANLRQKL